MEAGFIQKTPCQHVIEPVFRVLYSLGGLSLLAVAPQSLSLKLQVNPYIGPVFSRQVTEGFVLQGRAWG